MNTVIESGLAHDVGIDIYKLGYSAAIRKYKNLGYSFELVLLAVRMAYVIKPV